MHFTHNNLHRVFEDAFDIFNKVNFYGENIMNQDDITNLEIPLPGFSKKDINIDIEGRTLTISAEVSEENETRYYKSFKKVFVLPNNADAENINAKMVNGLLTIDFGSKSEKKTVNIK
tara:strand:+ start:6376 stop:6729 length:354 start_codon:yes stop_codon:yes gene_type:complete